MTKDRKGYAAADARHLKSSAATWHNGAKKYLNDVNKYGKYLMTSKAMT